jgi:hypothetical protein
MSSRTTKNRTQLEIAPAVKSKLKDYEARLQTELGRQTNSSDLLSAFLDGVPLWQADLMLGAYRTQE